MEQISASTIKADEVIRFQLTPRISTVVYYTDHLQALLLKQGCNFIYQFCFIVNLMCPKLINLRILAYKVVVFRINKTDFLMQLIIDIFLLFSQFLLAKSSKLI